MCRRATILAVFVLVVTACAADTMPPSIVPPAGDTSVTASPSPANVSGSAASAESAAPAEIERRLPADDIPAGTIVHTQAAPTGRPFSFYVPKAYDPSRTYPLLIECTGQGVGRENIRRVWQLADEFDLVVAAPDTWAIHGRPAAPTTAESVGKAWSRGKGEIDVPVYVRTRDEIMPDLRADNDAILAMINLLARQYKIDDELVVLTGYSGGAWTAYYVGVANPRRFAGICIRSGSFHQGFMPQNVAPARTLPITVVIGERDLEMILTDTRRAEMYFADAGFKRFQVERLPNSGHDNRPEVAGNFVQLLRTERDAARLEAARSRWERFVRAAESSLERGEREKAIGWFEKAAEMEAEFSRLPQTARTRLAELASGSNEAALSESTTPATTGEPAPGN